MPASLLPLALCLLPLAQASGEEGGGAHLRPTVHSAHGESHDLPGAPESADDGDHPHESAPLDPPGGVKVGETLEIHAWAGAGYSAHKLADGEVAFGPDVRMARMAGRVHYDHEGDIFFQFEASDGTARLLDARVSIEMGEHFEVRAGRMKTSTSAEYLVPQPILHHVNRARLIEWVPKRQVGVEAIVTPFQPGFDLQAGVFNVAGTEPVEGSGALLIGRLRFEPVHNFQVHLSYTDHQEGRRADPSFHPEHDQLIDGAIEFDTDGWMFHVEGLGRLENEAHGRGLVTFASVGHHFGHDPDGFGIEPVVAYDHIVEEIGVSENAAAGLNVLIHGHHLMQLTEFELHRYPDGTTDQAVYVQLRGGV